VLYIITHQDLINIALGPSALGEYNVALGRYAKYNTSGSYNVALGSDALSNNTTGYNNVALVIVH
jgi:trimeric autotransporter adhesin